MENVSVDKILSVDIGGSNIKVTVLDANGVMVQEYKKMVTPVPASPERVIATIQELIKGFPEYHKVSVGFPGYVRDGVVKTAPNLGTDLWRDIDLSKKLGETLNRPVRVVNDADMLGLGIVAGKGFEMVITLGTGFGTALLMDGKLMVHFEIAHHPVSKDQDYDQYVGEQALENKGVEKWNNRMQKVLAILKTVFNYDTLYIGGGNAKKLNFKLEDNIKLFSNKDGIKGGARLWKD